MHQSSAMRTIRLTTKYRKDFKKYARNPQKVQKIMEVVQLLESGVDIPPKYSPHKLIGNYEGHMELHVEGDLLLIWLEYDEEGEDIVNLVRVGTHSDLF